MSSEGLAGTSISETIASLDTPPPEKVEQAPAVQAETADTPDTEAAPTAEDASGPEGATGDETADTDGIEAEAEQAEQPPLDAPHFWDAKAKERFRELPRDLQEIVLAKETERDKATAKSLEEAALKRKAADGEALKLAQYSASLDKLIPQAQETFQSRWANVDWNAVVDQYGAEQALKLQNDFQREQRTLQQLEAAKAAADETQFARFVETEIAKLPEMCPDLVDPVKGSERRQALGKHLIERGIPASAIRNMSALETSIAYDAMCWRQSKDKAASLAATPKPAAPPSKTPVRPTAPVSRGSQQSAAVKSLEGRFAKDPSIKNLTALLDAKGP